MQSFSLSFSASPTNVTDQLALLAFKNLITNTNNVMATNWTTNTSFCSWIGVTCSPERQRVRALELPNLNLQGTISSSIANLSFLVMLNLANNYFRGNLPYGLGHLSRLRVIDVHNNQLEGDIPQSLFLNPRLETISLSHNRFTGDLWRETWNLPELRILNLTSNNLIGSIHPSIGNISMLERLILDHNSLSGNIPKEIGNLSHVIELDLSNNRLIGSIPPAIFNISSLRVLYLTNNSLSGFLSLNVENHQLNLEAIDLSSNQLTGEIPSSLCQFQELRFLYLSRNNFTGQIPRDIGFLSKLEGLYLTTNEITGGEIPQGLGNLLHLKMLGFDYNNLTDNQLSGEFPMAITNASKLIELELSYNFFTGSVPTNLGNLRQLQFLNLAEYGAGGIVSTSGDVYSYGIMLMETFTKRKPTEEMFTENSSLRYWVKSSYPTAVMKIVDANLFNGEDEMGGAKQICISSVIELALDCSRETPEKRIKMQEVVGPFLVTMVTAWAAKRENADCVNEIDAQRVLGYALFKDGRNTRLSYPLKDFHSDVAGRSFHNGRFIQRMREKAASLPKALNHLGPLVEGIGRGGISK
ncbi:hypothetical protein F0562_030559 [Nyssa sinensis]|uniref:Leucine-rich repeat-containing N-terminal plant-type domain-containing protein n=1 Tax=Nyssa sinensis TaxID=561372 RepID=A0A5J5AWR1_9ASTE|nr:hypothetical protein F0562_030559 [Nyssa sinensis]